MIVMLKMGVENEVRSVMMWMGSGAIWRLRC
jgi:hypothetical protein